MRHHTVSLGFDARIPFETKLGGVAVDASAGPAVTEVWLNGTYDAGLFASAAVNQLQDAGATNEAGAYEVVLDTSTTVVGDEVVVKVTATPTGGAAVSQLFAVSIVDPASTSVSSID